MATKSLLDTETKCELVRGLEDHLDDEECKGNAIEACAISQAGSSAKAWPFLLCYEGANRGSPDALNACAADAGLDALAIKDCSDGDAARSLLEDAARATCALDDCGGCWTCTCSLNHAMFASER